MPNQVLIIEPQNELQFKVDSTGKFKPGQMTYMQLTNPTSVTVLFKIKTTAPKKYCVRPNSGVLEPKEKVEVAITPQPVFVEQNENHKHKFMVQSLISPDDVNLDEVWKDAKRNQLMDYKLKCVFETASGTNESGDGTGQYDGKRCPTVIEEKPLVAKESIENFVQNEFKKKETDETKTFAAPKTGLLASKDHTDDSKVSSEVSHLREEENKLRSENLQLKEELLRLRQTREGRNVSPHNFGPPKMTNPAPVMPWLAIAVAMAVVGIIVGKFIM